MAGEHLCVGLRVRGAVIVTIFLALICMVDRGVAAGRPERFGGLPASELLEATPARVVFADVPVGETYTQTVRVSNISQEKITIVKVAGSGVELGISQLALPVVLDAGSSAMLKISYKPQRAGRSVRQVRVTTSASATPWTLEVQAFAIGSERKLAASDASVDFGDLAAGNGIGKDVTLTNVGNADVAISRIEVAGEGFTVSGGAVTLSAGQDVSLSVRFDPKDGGSRAGVLSIYSNAGDSPLQIALSGTAAEMSRQSVTLKWEKNEQAENGYFVYRGSEPGGPYTKLQDSALSTAEFTDVGLAAGRTYYYVVTSVDASGSESGYSEQIVVNIP
jgi:Abnormal spindle-like microcephaly-assoc'd, ASPM-SPD-2-Hydin